MDASRRPNSFAGGRYDECMATITESLHVPCPYVRAKSYLHETLSEAAKNAPQPLQLTATLPVADVQLEKTVLVHYAKGTDPMHFDEPWNVTWEPRPGGVYPSFSGTLTVRADEDYTGSILELAGAYAPPLGVAGALFDKALGQKIASVTMGELLAKIAERMMERYEREEAAKASAP